MYSRKSIFQRQRDGEMFAFDISALLSGKVGLAPVFLANNKMITFVAIALVTILFIILLKHSLFLNSVLI